ncbi:MAG: substrate-binding domain-containing protein [bacterium]|nr:substrate-binding domain-containing protein [bacterium]
MKIRSSTIFRIITSIVVVILLLSLYYYGTHGKDQAEPKAISLIVYGNETERWENLRRGADQAAEAAGAEVNLVTMSDETDAGEQKKLIQREINNGADALMIAACNSTEMKQYIEELSGKIPVILVESGIGYTDDRLCISADHYQMGYQLGETIIEHEVPEVKVAIFIDHELRDSVAERYQGLYDALQGRVDSITIWNRKDNEADIRAMLLLQRQLTEEAVDVVVGLDTASTEAVIDAAENLNKDVKLYGIGNSDQTVYYLDSGVVEALGYQNEFSIGYLGVCEVMGISHHTREEYNNMVEYRVVTKKSLYETDNQKMLFPFVK